MEVILLEKVRNLGVLGEKVTVKAGYGRNYLIPQHKAVFATPENIKMFEERRADLEKKAAQTLAKAEQRAAKLNDTTIVITAQASDEGKLYGSIGIPEVQKALLDKSLEVSKREINLPEGPFMLVGEHSFEVHVHSDVVAIVHVEIVAAK